MSVNNLFYQYYDVLYSDKKYEEETDYILQLAGQKRQPVKNVLEIGCGTGNHTLELAKRNLNVTSIDIDENMIEIARKKLTGQNKYSVNILHTGVEKLDASGFDMVLAMFNVITYINDMDGLIAFFDNIRLRLKPNGLLYFDCWNGLAALLDPPKIKTINKETAFDDISCKIISDTNLWEQKTTLNYFIQVRSIFNNTIKKDSFTFDQTLFTPVQIKYCLDNSGFEIMRCGKLLNLDEKATHTEWKIMYECKAI